MFCVIWLTALHALRQRVWVPARTAAGLPTLNFQNLEHTAGTAPLDDGINIKIAQNPAGSSRGCG